MIGAYFLPFLAKPAAYCLFSKSVCSYFYVNFKSWAALVGILGEQAGNLASSNLMEFSPLVTVISRLPTHPLLFSLILVGWLVVHVHNFAALLGVILLQKYEITSNQYVLVIDMLWFCKSQIFTLNDQLFFAMMLIIIQTTLVYAAKKLFAFAWSMFGRLMIIWRMIGLCADSNIFLFSCFDFANHK